MPSFTDSFWSSDYAGGLGVLFEKLQQGVTENQQVLTIAIMRAEAEETYSENLGSIAPTVDRMTKGFARDDGASLRKVGLEVQELRGQVIKHSLQAYEGVRSEMVAATQNHRKIASNIRELVVNPFGRWCDAHAIRIQNSQDDLQSKLKAHDKQAELVKKLRSQYFNKCRLVEDLEEENKLAFQDPEKPQQSPKSQPTPKIVLPESSDEEPEPVEIGDQLYNPEQIKKLLVEMLDHVVLGEVKVPILGTYQNTSTGADIVAYIQKYMRASTVSYAERIGQDLVDNGFLRLVGNVGSAFTNSSRMHYQWRPKVFQITGVPEKKKPVTRVSSVGSNSESSESPMLGSVNEMLQGWNPLNNPHPNETPAERLRRESREADEKYKAGVKRLDQLRCNLEESMMDHLKFLERCETDRLKAIKSVILDFSGAISNVVPAIQSQVDNMMLYQETIQPLNDLRYMLENYRTGQFAPKVVPYENYYGSVDEQTFGIDIEARARADKKRVPIIITTILTFLDNHYPDLDGDEARRSIWLVDVPLAATHHLRNSINNGKAIPKEVLERYEIPIVASVLKLYLLELPDSLVSSQVYEIVKTIYAHAPPLKATSSTDDPSEKPDPSSRIKVLQSTLGQLRLNNIATLDALTTHFTRLIDLTSADEAYVSSLANVLAPCILRPRTENSLTISERHSYRLIRDLFDYKNEIFGELKRQSSSGTLPSGAPSGGSAIASPPSARNRAVSATDESNRRANMEARAKAISERIRDKSPGPLNRHRRDKSVGEVQGRFPVVASPTATTHQHSASVSVAERIRQANSRHSLEVPSSNESSPVTTRDDSKALPDKPFTDSPTTNGAIPRAVHIPPPASTRQGSTDSPTRGLAQALSSAASTPTEETNNAALQDVEKQNSLKRSSGSGGKYVGRSKGLSRTPGSKGSLGGVQEVDHESTRGVTLEDKPMDD